jgi:hypothetical protein
MSYPTSFLIGVLACAGFAQTTPSVTLPKPDAEGWIKLYRGDNTSDFSIYTGNGVPSQNPRSFGDPFYAQGGDTIRTDGAPNAQLIFRQNFSHYVMQVQLRWPENLGNTGVMTKIQWNDPGQGDGLPRAVECQGDPGQGIGQIWALGNMQGQAEGTWITVRARMISHPFGGGQAAQADSTAPEIDWGGGGAHSRNLIVGFPGWRQPRPAALENKGWVTIEVESHGHDTTRHFVDGQKVMEYRNPRIAAQTNANNIVKRLTAGMLSVQSEGTQVWYRNWRIKLLPQDPLYESLYGPPVTLAPRPSSRSWTGALRLGFQDGVLTVLTEGRPAFTLEGRRLDAGLPAPARRIPSASAK